MQRPTVICCALGRERVCSLIQIMTAPSLNCPAEPALWLQLNFLMVVVVVHLQKLATDRLAVHSGKTQCKTTLQI